MKTLFLAAGLCLTAPALAQAPDDLSAKILAFDHAYVAFLHDYCHWSEIQENACHVSLGHINYGEFRKAREAAKKLFDLVDK